MIFNGSLAYITPLAVAEDEAVDIEDYEIVTGLSQDDYVLVAAPGSGFKTVKDLTGAGRPIKFGTTGVGTGSQLSQELLFAQADIQATAVPFDGGVPALTAVLGGQVDVGSIQLGEAMEQIEAGKLTPIVTFAEKRPTYLADTPTAVEAGYDVPVQQSRAIVAPKGTPKEVIDDAAGRLPGGLRDRRLQEVQRGQPADPQGGRRRRGHQAWTEQPRASTAPSSTKYGISWAGRSDFCAPRATPRGAPAASTAAGATPPGTVAAPSRPRRTRCPRRCTTSKRPSTRSRRAEHDRRPPAAVTPTSSPPRRHRPRRRRARRLPRPRPRHRRSARARAPGRC